MRVDTSLDASIHVVSGSSGSGKSVSVKKKIAGAKRLVVWDVDDEYGDLPGVERVTNIGELVRKLRTHKTGRFAFVGPKQHFERWCLAVFAWGQCVAVAEELAGVTSPGKAPDGWHTLVSRGRKRGISLFGVTQRPAESDKTIMGNASSIQVGRLARAQDRKYMAAELDVSLELVNRIPGLSYLRKDMADNVVYAGKIAVPRNGQKSLGRVKITENPVNETG